MADGRKKNGGKRPGAGRKSVHDEHEAKHLAIAAIVKQYGSLEQGMQHLLTMEEASLIKFVFEHAVGKPTDKVQHSGDPDQPVIFQTDARFKPESR